MKKLLLLVLAISAVVEIYLALGLLLKPDMLSASFGVALNNEALYMAAIIGWFCLLVTALVVLSMVWIYRSHSQGYVLAAALGLFWVGLGLHLGLAFARPQHLVLDAAKGFVILLLAAWQLKEKSHES